MGSTLIRGKLNKVNLDRIRFHGKFDWECFDYARARPLHEQIRRVVFWFVCDISIVMRSRFEYFLQFSSQIKFYKSSNSQHHTLWIWIFSTPIIWMKVWIVSDSLRVLGWEPNCTEWHFQAATTLKCLERKLLTLFARYKPATDWHLEQHVERETTSIRSTQSYRSTPFRGKRKCNRRTPISIKEGNECASASFARCWC